MKKYNIEQPITTCDPVLTLSENYSIKTRRFITKIKTKINKYFSEFGINPIVIVLSDDIEIVDFLSNCAEIYMSPFDIKSHNSNFYDFGSLHNFKIYLTKYINKYDMYITNDLSLTKKHIISTKREEKLKRILK